MDEQMDVDDNINEPFATKSIQVTPQRHLEDIQSNKENAVNPNISYEDLDVSEMNMRLRMSMSFMASPAIKVDSRRSIGLSSTAMNEQLNYSNARYTNVANVPDKSFDVSSSDMSIDEADTTLVLNSITETVENTNQNHTIQFQEEQIAKESPHPAVQNKEPLKVISNEPNCDNDSFYLNIENKNILTNNMNESSPIIRGLRSVINLFRPSQSPIPQSPSPLGDDKIVCLSDPSERCTRSMTPHAITVSDDYDPMIQKQNIKDESRISTSLSPQSSHIKKHLRKEENENKSTSEGVVFKEELINDLQWNDDSTIIFNTRKSTQNVRFSSSLSESPCDLGTESSAHSFTNCSGELDGQGMIISKFKNSVENHSIVEDSHRNITQNVELEFQDFQGETVEQKENHSAGASTFLVEQSTSNVMSVTEMTQSKHFDDATNNQNASILLTEVNKNLENSTVDHGNGTSMNRSCSIRKTDMELEPTEIASLSITAGTDNMEENTEIILNNDGNESYSIQDRTIELNASHDIPESYVINTEIDQIESKFGNSVIPKDISSYSHLENLEVNSNEEAINGKFDVCNTTIEVKRLSDDEKTNIIVEKSEQEAFEEVNTAGNEICGYTSTPTSTKIGTIEIQNTLLQNITSTFALTENHENIVPMELDISVHSTNTTLDITNDRVTELDIVNMTPNEEGCRTEKTTNPSSMMNSDNKFKYIVDRKSAIKNTTINYQQSSFTEVTENSASYEGVKVEIPVDDMNESLNLDQSIYESANNDSQNSILDSKEKFNTEHKLMASQESELLSPVDSFQNPQINEDEPNNVSQIVCPITMNYRIETSVEVETAQSNELVQHTTSTDFTQEEQVDEKILGNFEVKETITKVEMKKLADIDFDKVENPFATVTRVRTSQENLSPNKMLSLDESITLNQVQTTKFNSTMIIQDESLNITKDIVQDEQDTSSSLQTCDATFLQAEKVSNDSLSTQDAMYYKVSERVTLNEIVDTKDIHLDINDLEDPFVTKTKIRESFSTSTECADVGNKQLDRVDAFMNKTETEIQNSACSPKDFTDVGNNLFDCRKDRLAMKSEIKESPRTSKPTIDSFDMKFDDIENPFITKTNIRNSASPSKECTNIGDNTIFSGSENKKSLKDTKDTGEIQFDNIENPFITKTNIRNSASPSKECTNIGDNTIFPGSENNKSLKDTRDTGEIQFDNIENPFITKSNIRDSASPSKECTDMINNSTVQTGNTFVAESEIKEPCNVFKESTVASELKFESLENTYITKSRIKDADSSYKDFTHDGDHLFKSGQDPLASISQIRESPRPSHRNTDADANNAFNTIGTMQQGYFPSTNEEIMELDRSIEEEFIPGELFADPDAFDYFMSRTNKNVVLDKAKDSLFTKFDPLYSATTNSEGVVSSLANLPRNGVSIDQCGNEVEQIIDITMTNEESHEDKHLDNVITANSSIDDVGETTFMVDTDVVKEINPIVSVSNSTFHAYHNPTTVEQFSDLSFISHEVHNLTLEVKKNDFYSTTNACDDGINNSSTIQSDIQTLGQQNIVKAKNSSGKRTNSVEGRKSIDIHSRNAMEEPKDNDSNALHTHCGSGTAEINETERSKNMIAARSRSSINKSSSYSQAADINKQTVQNTFTVSQDSTKIMENTTLMQNSFNNTFDKLTGSGTEKPTLMVSPAINSEKMNTPNRSTPLSTDREISTTPVSPAMAVINRLIFERTTPSVNSHNATHVNFEGNQADTVLCEIPSSQYPQHIEVGDEYNQLQQENRLMVHKIAEYELKLKNMAQENAEKVEKINLLQNKLTKKSSENKSMATVMEEYERTISQLISEREVERSKQAEERKMLICERDEQTAHLASMEYSFNDLHTKYEKSKVIVKAYRTNEEALKKTFAENEVSFRKLEANYSMLQQHATAKLNAANEELEKIKKQHHDEICKLNALVKRKEVLASSLQESLLQEKKNSEQLAVICDELINKVG